MGSNHKTKIKKVLIANRGEIALRVKRACEKLGIIPVGVCSEADKDTFFTRQFKELVHIGPPPAAQSYLNQVVLIEAAKKHGCDAIHPGYGFLSENAEFAKRVRDAGLIFIGPSVESIDILGDKTKARACVQQNNVPCVPGSKGGLSDVELTKRAEEIGFPIIIKAAAGGGGRGMRTASSKEEMQAVLPRARAEAKKFFSSEDVFIEKFIISPRHVEVQVFGDMHGTVLHFGTRECSSQRRHQKIIEEAPAPALSDALREAIHTAAVQAAKSVNYYNAGTAEFLVSGESFYFLEMNTRIQVEHPVTEEVTGVDLVELQLRVAEGEKLPMTQREVTFTGHAIELRVYAEDAENDFSPSLGKIFELEWLATDACVRKEFGFAAGDTISPHYDAMIGKIIVHEGTRLQAIEGARKALRAFKISGIKTNLEFLEWLLLFRKFRKSELSIQDIGAEFTPQLLEAVRKRNVLDPMHRSPVNGAEYVERRVYQSSSFATEYVVDILHRFDGTFVVSPSGAAPVKASYQRRSNDLEAALKALCSEVLEKFPPSEIFS